MPQLPEDVPLNIETEDGHVLIDGGPGVAITMSPQAAAETSDRMLEGANHAAGQRRIKKLRDAEDAKNR